MKKFVCVIGVGLVIGAVANAMYLLLKNKKKKKCDVCCDCKEPKNQETPAKDISLAYTKVVEKEPMYEDIKSTAIGSMCARHKDAASIMKESVETIHENVKVSENTNNEIDQVSAELDKMLSED